MASNRLHARGFLPGFYFAVISKRVSHVFILDCEYSIYTYEWFHMRAHTEYVQSLICVYCTECAVMNRNAMPCLAMPCLALPRMCIYIYIVWCRGGVCKLQFLYCFSSPRAGCSAWHLRPSTLCGERSEHGWRPLFLGQRSLACFADCKWFSIRAHFRIIWKHLFIILYISLCFPMFFSSQSCCEADFFALQTAARLLEQLGLGASGPGAADLVPLDMRLYSNRQTT